MDIPTGPHFMFITFILIYYPATQHNTGTYFFIPVFSVQEASALLHLFWPLPDLVLLL